ncbi:MAG: 50S ribosomal protein L9 [Eubacteriales bacterium]
MKIILLEDVKTLGKKGQIIDANDGYARNYIIPKKIGIEASPKNLNDLKLQNSNKERVAKEQLEEAQNFGKELETKAIIVTMKAGEGGRSFGSVSSKEIATAYKDQWNIELDKKKIQISDSIKTFGTHEVKVKLHPKVTATLRVKVQEA